MGKKTSKTKSTSTPWAPAQPILTGAGNSILNTVNGNAGNLSNIEQGITGGTIPGIQQQIGDQKQQMQPGLGYIGQTLGTNPGLNNPANDYLKGSLGRDFLNANPANGYLGGTLNKAFLNSNPADKQLGAIGAGKYLGANPYTNSLAQFAGQQAGNAVNSAFSSAGRTGSDNHATDLARGVDQASNGVLFQNYQNERGLMNQALGQQGQDYNTALGIQSQNAAQMGQNYNTAVGQQQNAANMLGSTYNAGLGAQANAAGMLPGYGTSQFAGYSPLLGAQQLGGQLPYYGANAAGNVGGLFNGYGQQTSQQPGGWLNGLLGAGASLGSAAIMASDRRLKTKIELKFRDPDGLGWYEWNWKSNPNGEREYGVIADEVEKIRPHAFVKGFVNGIYDGVNYAALGGEA